MIPFEDALGQTLRKMGLAEPALMLDLETEWSELVGEPWSSKARPLFVRSGVLVVEASDPGAVAFLRYGVGELQRRLGNRFGEDVVSRVEIRPPSRRREP
ncbi:MAG: DUF721 domain-containing protein [Acidimicrobiia bacterium]